MVTVTGKLVTPSNGVIADATLTFTSNANSNLGNSELITGTTSNVVTDANGEYSITLNNGGYKVLVSFGSTNTLLGNCVIDASTPATLDVLELVAASGVTQSVAQDILDQAIAAKNAAAASETAAAASAASVDANQIVHSPGSGLANEAGTAYTYDVTTSPADTTADRLTKVGDYGMGTGVTRSNEYSTGQDFNNFLISGLYFIGGSNNLHTPLGLPTGAYSLLVNNNQASHIYIEQTATLLSITQPRKFFRSKVNSTWSAWVEIYNTGMPIPSSAISYINTSTGLTATNIQQMGDEIVTGDVTFSGIKNFTESPIVPTVKISESNYQVATTEFVKRNTSIYPVHPEIEAGDAVGINDLFETIVPTQTTTTLFGNLSGTGKWYGGVLAPNGKIYGTPFGSTQVLEIDPVTQTTTLFGSLSGSGKWAGGVLAPNGKIYGIPHGSTQVLEIDPVTQTTTLFGNLSGSSKWIGGVLAPNGKIYCTPFVSTQVLEIDPVTQTTTLFGNLSGTGKWYGGVLAPNGKIYCIPYSSTQVLEIDPVTQTTTLFGNLSGLDKWAGGVLAPNGKIYCTPHSSAQVLEIDPSTQTTTLFGSLSGVGKWIGGVLAPNGKIYCTPRDSTQVLEIDPVTQTTTTLFGSLSGSAKWFGGVLAPNGKIYGIPFYSTQVLEIDQSFTRIPKYMLSAYFNKL